MKNYKRGSVVLILLVIMVLVIAGGFYYWTNNKVASVQEESSPAEAFNTEYSFNTITKEDPNKKYPEVSVEVWKKGILLKTLRIMESGVGASNFIISPDNKYVAFKTMYAGGTCVYVEQPHVIDLNTLSLVTFQETFRRATNDVNIITVGSIKWNSNEEIELGMEYGEKDSTDCGPYSTQTLKLNLNQKD